MSDLQVAKKQNVGWSHNRSKSRLKEDSSTFVGFVVLTVVVVVIAIEGCKCTKVLSLSEKSELS